ncbi:MAG TPA: flagellar filament capping protein FliD [Gemmatimonadaceae bacterium]|nr:flagellar filament capping protein FliD [Gemmatimonadaceae bacterium]
MADPISSFSGLASGVQWRDLVDQLITIDTQRRLDPITTKKTAAQSRVDAWSKYQVLSVAFRDAAKGLRDSTAFGAFQVTGGTSVSSGRTLLTATASAGATPGNYAVEVLDLARANKLSGNVVTSASSALGLSGEFGVNGQKVTIVATDTLSNVRDKINALNTGASASGVTASVLSTGSTQHRLVLSADQTGASGIELIDDATGVLSSLGIVDGTKTLNVASDGGVQSQKVSSATAAIATMLGVSMPPPSTIEVGGRTIAVDLSVDSLASIAARIMAAGGNASVVSETAGGKTGYRLVTSDTLSATTVDGQRALEVLGFVKNGRSGVTQAVSSENAFTDALGAAAGAATLLSDLRVNGNALALAAGDTFSVQGTRGDGSTVSLSFAVGASDTMQTLVNKINDATSGFGAGTRTATASLSGGKIVLTDGTSGDSQLSLSLSATRVSDGSVVSLGRQLVTTVGRQREVVAGSDAKVRVDGVVVKRSTNTISDALNGVTLNLQQAEVGSTVSLTVGRDLDALTDKVKAVATAYNALVSFRAEQQKDGAALKGNTTLRSTIATLTSSLLSNVSGLSGSYTRAGAAGLALQADGSLKLDETVFKGLLTTNFSDVVNLFNTAGSSTNSQLGYWTSTGKTVPGTYAVNITAAATTPTVTGAGFSGTYTDDATADTLTISDSISGASGSIALANGDTIDTIVTKLNSLFSNSKMSVTASKSGNELVLTGSRYGSTSTFTIAYTAGGADGTAQLGLAAATVAGTDVAGTIGGVAALGSGQILTAKPPIVGDPTDGLAVSYTGTATGAVGDIAFTLGVSGMLFNTADVFARADGTIFTQQEQLERSINELTTRADTVQQSLDRRRAALLKQFTAMETAISRIQAQGSTLVSFINSMNSSNN